MNIVWLFLGLLFFDLVFGNWVGGTMLLLILPFFQFLNGRRLTAVLMGGFCAGFAVEAIHGLLPGTVLIGIGLAVFLVHCSVGFINWSLPIVQWVGFVLYVSVIFFTRFVLLIGWNGNWFFPNLLPWLMTVVFSLPVFVIRWRSRLTTPRGERLTR